MALRTCKTGPYLADDPDAEEGCAFPLDHPDWEKPAGEFCDAPRRPGSAYCAPHHAICHLAPGSAAELRRLRVIEALADAAGGRLGRIAREPPPEVLRRIERLARASLRSDRSRIVLEGAAMKQQPARRKLVEHTAGEGGPTPERLRQGPVEQLARAIADVAGNPSRPHRAVDTLSVMERRGSITAGMHQAGEDFRARFAVAQLDPLRAVDLSHLRLGERSLRPDSGGPGLRIEAARTAVWRAVQAVGGIASPAGSCLWHVIGWERSLKEWAFEQGWNGRRVSQEAASGILVAALGALEAHFGRKESLRR
jgi:hypothetical protein